ncbi:MAG: CDP-alcohol phosphatidyltransferase family protein [Haloarculaceae archaeon]
MADSTSHPVQTIVGAVQARTDSEGSGLGIGRFLSRLSGADYLSLAALFAAWTSALLILDGAPNWGLVAMFVAFFFDKLDGFYARRYGEPSPFGRQVDSFIDIFTYLVTAALLYHVALAPNTLVSALVGFTVVCFGGLRLVRHNDEGFQSTGETSYYRGTTVVHTNVVVVANYLLALFIAEWTWWLATVPILLSCPLMVSEYRAFKTVWGHVLVGAFGVAVGTVSVLLALGVL